MIALCYDIILERNRVAPEETDILAVLSSPLCQDNTTRGVDMSSRTCPTCNREFNTKRGMFIHHAQAHGESIAGVELACHQCGTSFRRKPSRAGERNFCSQECHREWRWSHYSPEDHPSWNGGPVKLECDQCGKQITVNKYRLERSKNLFCSSECMGKFRSEHYLGERSNLWKGGPVEVRCSSCGKSIHKSRHRLELYDRHYCDMECKKIWQRRNLTGKDNPHWLGGAEGYFSWQIEAEGDWDINKDRALERDNHTCLLCRADAESLGRNPDVHHIIPLRNGGTNLLRNLACLCRSCHQQIEGKTVRRLGLNQRASDEEAAQVRGWFWDKVNLDTMT